MSPNEISRRRAVTMALGAGLSATGAAALGAGALARRLPTLRPVSMAMHVHASFSEGGSWLACGGGASMMAQLHQATRNGVDVIWWTEHDWRMQAYGYFDGIAFDGTAENGRLEWIVQNEGAVESNTVGKVLIDV